MASWVGGGGRPLDATIQVQHRRTHRYIDGGKRRVSHPDDIYTHDPYHGLAKRARLESWAPFIDHDYDHDHNHEHDHHDHHHHHHGYDHPDAHAPPLDEPTNQSFIIIQEHSPTPDPPLHPGLAACAMERTESGLSISSDTTRHSCDDEDLDAGLPLLADLAAARLVREHVAGFRRRCPDSQHGRILKALINPKSRGADFPLDNEALRSIFSAANELFFANRLARRVDWDWSHPTSAQYASHIVGTTALRRSARLGGYETLIVLSSPILKDTQYNRRLLISTFLHEMIHSFLFVACGLKARECGGHTEGFRQIAEIIDDWVGREILCLSDMEADLERFRGWPPAVDDVPVRGRPEWRDEPRHERDDYLTEPRPRRRHDHDEWQWHEREGFRARSSHSAGSSSYVY